MATHPTIAETACQHQTVAVRVRSGCFEAVCAACGHVLTEAEERAAAEARAPKRKRRAA